MCGRRRVCGVVWCVRQVCSLKGSSPEVPAPSRSTARRPCPRPCITGRQSRVWGVVPNDMATPSPSPLPPNHCLPSIVAGVEHSLRAPICSPNPRWLAISRPPGPGRGLCLNPTLSGWRRRGRRGGEERGGGTGSPRHPLTCLDRPVLSSMSLPSPLSSLSVSLSLSRPFR